jgi:hypothetical protein
VEGVVGSVVWCGGVQCRCAVGGRRSEVGGVGGRRWEMVVRRCGGDRLEVRWGVAVSCAAGGVGGGGL